MKSFSALFFAVVAAILLLGNGAVIDAQNYSSGCHDIHLWNGTTINLSPENWGKLMTDVYYYNRFFPDSGMWTVGSAMFSLCNKTAPPSNVPYGQCPWSYMSLSTNVYNTQANCQGGYANEVLNVTHRWYPFDAVYFEYRSNNWRTPYTYNKTQIVCFCNQSYGGDSLSFHGNIVTSRAYSRNWGSFDNTVYVGSSACCARRRVPPAPPRPHNLTRCQRIFTPDGEGVIPLDNWGALRNTWYSVTQNFNGMQSYQTWNVSLCDPMWVWNPRAYNYSRQFMRELGGELELQTMTRDPYLNSRRQVVFTYQGFSKERLPLTATVNCMCNPSVGNVQIVGNQYKMSQVNYRYEASFDVMSAACCPRPTADYVAELEYSRMSIFGRLVKYVRSFFF